MDRTSIYTELFTLGGTNGQICITVGGLPPVGRGSNLGHGWSRPCHEDPSRLWNDRAVSRWLAIRGRFQIRNPQSPI